MKGIICLFVGHKRICDPVSDKVHPLCISWNGAEYYPMWACKRCSNMYVDQKNKSSMGKTYKDIDEVATIISGTHV